MIQVTGFEDFRSKFEQLGPLRDLHLFVLFDEPTKKIVQTFVEEKFDWLDRLAAASKVFGYAFVYRDHESDRVANPSLQVAELFDIRPKHLPGVIIFSMLPDMEGVADGLFLPIEPEALRKETAELETFFADVFSFLQDALDSQQASETHVEAVRRCLRADKRQQTRDGFWRFVKGQLGDIPKLPGKLIEAIGAAFGQEAAKWATRQ